jgi:hypothetical protein
MRFREACDAWESYARSLERLLPIMSPMEKQVQERQIAEARNTARAIELHRETGVPHCGCTDPPHRLDMPAFRQVRQVLPRLG